MSTTSHSAPAQDQAQAILPGATLGVLGGGRLGRMFAHAAQSMGYFTAVLDADATSPAGLVSHHHVRSGYEDPQGLAEPGASVRCGDHRVRECARRRAEPGSRKACRCRPPAHPWPSPRTALRKKPTL